MHVWPINWANIGRPLVLVGVLVILLLGGLATVANFIIKSCTHACLLQFLVDYSAVVLQDEQVVSGTPEMIFRTERR